MPLRRGAWPPKRCIGVAGFEPTTSSSRTKRASQTAPYPEKERSQIVPHCIIACKVIPKAHKSEVVGWDAGVLKVRLAAVPEKGKANDELIRLLADQLGIAKSRITLISGDTSRQKRVRIEGMSEDTVVDKTRQND